MGGRLFDKGLLQDGINQFFVMKLGGGEREAFFARVCFFGVGLYA